MNAFLSQAPEALEYCWNDILRANHFRKRCIQDVPQKLSSNISENCLYLNVYVPGS